MSKPIRAVRAAACIAWAAALLTACGGGGADERAVAQGERDRALGLPAQTVVAAAAAPVPVETPVHGCVRQINVALKSKATKVNADCLAGTYFGIDVRGKECSLHIAASQGRFRFVEREKALAVEADVPAATGAATAYAIERADVETGQIGLALSRRGAVDGRDVETLELSAGETSKGPLDLAAASYTRVKSGDVTIVRCFFDS